MVQVFWIIPSPPWSCEHTDHQQRDDSWMVDWILQKCPRSPFIHQQWSLLSSASNVHPRSSGCPTNLAGEPASDPLTPKWQSSWLRLHPSWGLQLVDLQGRLHSFERKALSAVSRGNKRWSPRSSKMLLSYTCESRRAITRPTTTTEPYPCSPSQARYSSVYSWIISQHALTRDFYQKASIYYRKRADHHRGIRCGQLQEKCWEQNADFFST